MFSGTTKPTLLGGFVDRSEKNDICSHWELDLGKYVIAVWVNYDDPDRREEDWQYAVGIRETDEYEHDSFVYFDEPNIHKASERIRAEVFTLMNKFGYGGKEMIPDKPNYDKTDFFEAMKLLHQYQVGDKYYYLSDGKIVQGTIYEVNFKVYDHGMTHTVHNELTINMNIILIRGASKNSIPAHQLFKTREEAAERFLQENDVPSELLRVIKQEKPKTTVADLIEKLKAINPETDLDDDYQDILNRAIIKYLGGLKRDDTETV